METKKYTLHPRQMFLPLAVTTVLTVCSMYCLGMAFASPSSWTYWVLGIAGILFFGNLSIRGILQVKKKKALLTLGEEGYTDTTLYNTPYFVPYKDIADLHYYKYKKKRFIGVNLTPEGEDAFLAGQEERMREAFLANKEVSGYLSNLPLDYIFVSAGDFEAEIRSRMPAPALPTEEEGTEEE